MKAIVKKWWFWAGIVAIVMILVFIFGEKQEAPKADTAAITLTPITIAPATPTPIPTEKSYEAEAIVAAKTVVKEYLVSPSSAKFSWSDYKIYKTDRQYKVTGQVESKNSFGVMITSDFAVKIEFTEDYKDYAVKYVQIDKQIYVEDK